MNIAELKGEKSVKTLAKRLLAEPGKDTPRTTQGEMEAALLRLNPQLSQIGDLEKGAPIIVPDTFALAPEESSKPTLALTDELLRQAEATLISLQEVIKKRSEQFTAQSDEVQKWVKSQAAKDLVKESPELKEILSDAASAAKTFPKEQAAVVTTETKALEKVAEKVKSFRLTNIRVSAAESSSVTRSTKVK